MRPPSAFVHLRGWVKGFALAFACSGVAACGGATDVRELHGSAAGMSPGGGAAMAGSGVGGLDASAGTGSGSCFVPAEPVDGGTLRGDVKLASEADATKLASTAELMGSLIILPSYAGPLYLPNLRRIGGDLMLDASPSEPPSLATHLRLPSLERIDGSLWIYHGSNLVELDVRDLKTVGSDVFILQNVALSSVRFDNLVEVGGNVAFLAQDGLPACALEPYPLFDAWGLANGAADTRCHCESPCGYPVARCSN